MLVRPARDADLPAIRAIYAPHVQHGTASFEEAAPDVAEMARRRAAILARGLPYLVAEVDGAVCGYAYAGAHRTRSAYRFTVEDSIYVAREAVGRGLGRALLADLLDRCTALGCRQMLAVIGDSGNAASIGLHATAGFRQVGTLQSVGFKFGRWLDVVLMQRPLGPGADSLPDA